MKGLPIVAALHAIESVNLAISPQEQKLILGCSYNKFSELDDGSNDARSFQARQRAKTIEKVLKK